MMCRYLDKNRNIKIVILYCCGLWSDGEFAF